MGETGPGAGTLDRAILILSHLATMHEASIAELAEAADTTRSTAYRLVARLHTWGLVQPHETEPGHWIVGTEALRLGLSVLQRSRVAHAAPEPLRYMVELTGETCGLAIASGTSMIFVHREPGPRPSPASFRVGGVRPMHCSSVGKAYLAALPEQDLARLLPRLRLTQETPASLVGRAHLERDLALTRRRGWSIDAGETTTATGACGAAVLDEAGRPVAAISASGPLPRIRRRADELGPVVAATAAVISRRLGFQTSHP